MAKDLNSILLEYAESHQNPLNVKIHSICVPTIMWSLLGMLSVVPLFMGLNLAHALVLFSLAYYASFKNFKLVSTMLVVVLAMLFSLQLITNILLISSIVFVISWLGQFYGHKVEGKKPSFFKDLQFLLIGPVWVIGKYQPKLMGLEK